MPQVKSRASKGNKSVKNGETSAQKGSKKKDVEREVLYPEYRAEARFGDNPLTIEEIDAILGWCEDPQVAREKGVKYPTFIDDEGKEIFCLNNSKNRPFDLNWGKELAQEHLNRRYAPKGPNGESVIIGRTGLVLSAQHRLVAAKIAEKIRTGPQAPHWKQFWDGPITMETFIVYGIDESPETLRTLDNVKKRTLSDVLFTQDAFVKASPADRKHLTKMADMAVKVLWVRTGADTNAFTPRRTHSEALDFIDRHPKVLECVQRIWDLYKSDWTINHRRFNGGYAAALLYLMASAGTSEEMAAAYHAMVKEGTACEKKGKKTYLDWSDWERACQFWAGAVSDSPQLEVLHKALLRANNEQASRAEKAGIVVKAWGYWYQGRALTPQGLIIHSDEDKHGFKRIDDWPECGGIDLGESPRRDNQKGPEEAAPEDLTPVESAEALATRRKEQEELEKKQKAIAEKLRKNKKKGQEAPPVQVVEEEVEEVVEESEDQATQNDVVDEVEEVEE